MSARSTAALLDNPGCLRRAVLDGAMVDKAKLSGLLDVEVPFGQSPFALGQGNRFEARVKAHNYAELVRVLAEHGIVLPSPPRCESINGGFDNELRVANTRTVLRAIAEGDPGAPHIIDQGMTRLLVGTIPVYLEQDALAVHHQGRLHICEIKSFPLVDGTADPEKVGAAARQSAVYLASVEDTLAELGLDTGVVSPEVILICPRNYTTRPTSTVVHVGRELRALRRQLARRARIDEQLAELDLSLLEGSSTGEDDGAANEAEQVAHGRLLLEALPYRYGPACLSSCDLGRLCRAEATAVGAPCTLGDEAANLLAATPTLVGARALAGGADPEPANAEVAATLRRARGALTALAPAPAPDPSPSASASAADGAAVGGSAGGDIWDL